MADPRESLDLTCQRQAEQLADLRRRMAEAAAGAPREVQRPGQGELAAACAQLEVTVEVFRVRKETGQVASDAAGAQNRLGEAWSGLSARPGNAGEGEMASQRQRQLLAQVRSGITGLAECGGRLDRHVGTLRRLRAELAGQARQALEDGREDLAREAVARGAGIDRQLAQLVGQRDSWLAEAARFTAACERLGSEAGG